MDGLIELEELMNFLGYKGEASALNWCLKYNIPIQTFGKRKYADRNAFNSLVVKSLGLDHSSGNTIGHRPSGEVKSPSPGNSNGKTHSEAAQKFLNKFKSEENEKGADNI